MNDQQKTRGVVACARCESVFAAWIWPDGKMRPIGTPANCPCGSDEFRPLE